MKAEGAKMEIRGVCQSYGEDWERQTVLDDVNLEIVAGELTAIVGPSGCGKSTLVNLIAGFEKPVSGTIELNGNLIKGPGNDRMVVFQETALMPWLTTYQNVIFGPKLRGEMSGGQLKSEAESILETVGLLDFKDKYPLQLSGGMQRRAELARALINKPLVMIMDEPFRGLDAMTRELMQEFYLQLCEKSIQTNVFVTSEIDEAILLADRLVVLSNLPATVREVIDIDLPRPRKLDVLSSVEAYEYKRQAMEILHEEALKSFNRADTQNDFMDAYSRQV